MSSKRPTLISLFAVTQNPSDIEKSIEFYKDFGFIEDPGYEVIGALRLPDDPYMHLVLNSWTKLAHGPVWPAPYNQLGSRGLTLLVSDAVSELARIRAAFPTLRVLQEPLQIRRGWGLTTSVLVLDPESVFLELVSIEYGQGHIFDAERVVKPAFEAKQWLHFMLNCSNFQQTKDFYKSFGMEHDAGVDFRPVVGFHPLTYDGFNEQMKAAFGFDMNNSLNVAFLRPKHDHISGMHLELCGHVPASLKHPDDEPTWSQKGIARYCFRVKDYEVCLQHQKARGSKIYIEDQREWGDTQWCFTGDPDGNIVTQEQWFPTRFWGERD
ncbi:hypothetical protein FDECE_2715 [Fusarium decemcellulare]|nr:hypothetical protein FDECE_2715 [Fusarium decemcellulare]